MKEDRFEGVDNKRDAFIKSDCDNNVLLQDIEIPDIVLTKASEAFSQISNLQADQLHQQSANGGKGKNHMKIKKIVIALGASAAILAAAIYIPEISFLQENKEIDVAEEKTPLTTNPFVIKVLAAELSNSQERPIQVDGKGNGWSIGGDDDDYIIDYSINIPFTCEGDDIMSITYTINQGAFQILEPQNEKCVISGIDYEQELNVGAVGEGIDSFDVGSSFYKSVTIGYDQQGNEHFFMNVCGISEKDMDIWNGIFGEIDDVANYNGDVNARNEAYIKRKAEAMNKLLSGIEIEVKANFIDGTSSEKVVLLKAGVIPCEPLEMDGGQVSTEVQVYCKLKD